jgi:tetratricopeptide (TPR) repeat protein
MNKKLWTSAIAAVIVGLSSVCRADSASQPTGGSDLPNSYSAAALYNLGNSYARQGKPALAVLNYERARVLAPRDPDIRANLRQLRASTGLAPEPTSFGDHLRWFSPNAAYWIGCAGLLTAGVGWLLLSFRRSHPVAARAAVGFGLLLMAFTVNDALALARLKREAVVLQSTAAGASPISGGEPLFTVPQATVVQQQDEHAGFSLIRDPQGRVGWVPRTQLLPIIDPQGDGNAKN